MIDAGTHERSRYSLVPGEEKAGMHLSGRALIMILVWCLATVAPCWGASTLVIASRGNGLFEILGEGLENVGRMDLVVGYDPATLTDPRVAQGAMAYGAMMTPDLSAPGVIRIGISSPRPHGITGAGSIALLTFNRAGGGGGKVATFAATLVSPKGVVIPAQTRILRDDKVEPPADRGAAPAPVSDVPAPGSKASAGTPAAKSGVPPAAGVQVPRPADPPVRPVTPDARGGKNVLTLFREYRGPKSAEAFTALFAQAAYPGLRQDPAVALSDGITQLKVFLAYKPAGAVSPNFAAAGARLVSVRKEAAEYVLTIIPDATVSEAAVIVLNQGMRAEYPLVVAPPLDAGALPGGAFDDAGFALFLKNPGGTPVDLNGDGRRDYQDEYIFTANYLAKSGKR